jgi:hypothetical protein
MDVVEFVRLLDALGLDLQDGDLVEQFAGSDLHQDGLPAGIEGSHRFCHENPPYGNADRASPGPLLGRWLLKPACLGPRWQSGKVAPKNGP